MRSKILSLRGIQKNYRIYDRNIVHRLRDAFLPGATKHSKPFLALKGIDLDVRKGEIVGIVGRNGSGKSTLMKIISGITFPSEGSMDIRGNVVPLLELGGGFNPEYTGRENIYLNCALLGLNKEEIDRKYDDIVEFSELEEFMDTPLKKYSSGMKARLGFAVSINIDPDILILDEVLSVGDALFKRKCFVKMQEFFKSGKTIFFVSHNAESILNICSRVVLLHKGEMILDGEPEHVMEQYNRLLNCARENENWLIKELKGEAAGSTPGERGSLIEPKSTVIVSRKNTRLMKAALRDHQGDETHLLEWGKWYTLDFQLEATEPLESIKVEVIIHDDQSRKITECCYPESYDNGIRVPENRRFSFSCSFRSCLRPGLYGVTFIIRTTETGRIKNVIKAGDIILFKMGDKTISVKSPVQLFDNSPIFHIGELS